MADGACRNTAVALLVEHRLPALDIGDFVPNTQNHANPFPGCLRGGHRAGPGASISLVIKIHDIKRLSKRFLGGPWGVKSLPPDREAGLGEDPQNVAWSKLFVQLKKTERQIGV
jgi:hypothetical protein